MEYSRIVLVSAFLFFKKANFKLSVLLFLLFGSLSSIVFSQSPNTTSYAYDALGRLRMVQVNGTLSESYQYDRAGNRCKVVSGTIADGGYCSDSVTNENYSSTWFYSSSLTGSVYTDSDGTFTLTWGNAPGFINPTEFHLWYQPPSGSSTSTNLGLVYSKALTGLAPGLHDFVIQACGVESYDENEYEVIGCGRWLRIKVTVQ